MAYSAPQGYRSELLTAAARFVRAVVAVPGVRRVSLLGSIMTAKPDPKDIDLLLTISDDADVAAIALYARRLQGQAQQCNRGADVFLANEQDVYLGRTCRWRDCRPGIRASCDALHCGTRPHLHDDFSQIRLASSVVTAPPVTLWPGLIRRVPVPVDVERMISELTDP
jgi:hypothetical protein